MYKPKPKQKTISGQQLFYINPSSITCSSGLYTHTSLNSDRQQFARLPRLFHLPWVSRPSLVFWVSNTCSADMETE